MQIFIHSRVGCTLLLNITSSYTIEMIKDYIVSKLGIPIRHQLLLHRGKIMPEYGSYVLEDNDIIQLRLRINRMPTIF